MTAIHFIGGEKGGVGKSVVARLAAQLCIDRGLLFVGYDADRSHSTFARFYSGYASPVMVDSYAGLDGVVEAFCADPARLAIVDLAAQSQRQVQAWSDDSGMPELLAEQGRRPVFWHVMDDSKDALITLRALLDGFADRVAYAVVLNHGRASSFSAVLASPELARARALGAAVIELPRLHEATMRTIDQQDASFWAATQRGEGGGPLGLLERQRVRVWLRRCYEQMTPILAP